jgi:hypothetical protein
MNQFITLTAQNGTPVTVNLAHIQRVAPTKVYHRTIRPGTERQEYPEYSTEWFDGTCLVTSDGDDGSIEVREDYERVASALDALGGVTDARRQEATA